LVQDKKDISVRARRSRERVDLQVMVTTGGRERTETEHRALLEAAAFRVTKVVPTQSEMSVVECVPV